MHAIDAVLNRFTMYKVVLYGLLGLLLASVVLALTGRVSVSAGGIALSVVVLGLCCYVTNEVLARLMHAVTNSESYLITACILALILPPITSPTRLGLAVLAGVIAMVSKYTLVVRGSHVFNPAAIAAFVMSAAGLLPATWWVATPALAPFTALLALIILRKQRKFTVFCTFAGVALAMLLFVGAGLHSQPLGQVLHDALVSWPIVFFGSIMLIEPITLPATKYYQLWFAILVGAVFAAQLHAGRLATTPEASLLLGNIFALIFVPSVGVMLKLQGITRLSSNIYEAVFEQPRPALAFAPGQYMEWTLGHKGADIRGNRRMFSVASSPTESDIRVGFRHYEHSSSFKTALLAMRPGMYIRAAHAAGNFTLPNDTSKPMLWIAGGIGITPFRSMAGYLLDIDRQTDITLLYFANQAEDFVYRDILEQAASLGVKTQYIVGRPTAEVIQAATPDVATRTAYLSGPDALVSSCAATLKRLGAKHIKTDHFTGY